MVSIRERFNNLNVKKRAFVIEQAGQHLDWMTEFGYIYHVYVVDNNFAIIQYDPERHEVMDIWMLEFRELDWLVQDIDIDDIWM